MFSTPSVRVFSSENAGATLKKPAAPNTAPRKPFLDRSVNSFTPNVQSRPKREFGKETPRVEEKLKDADDLFIYDTSSYREVEDEYFPMKCNKEIDCKNILYSFYNYKCETPPPEFEPHELILNPVTFDKGSDDFHPTLFSVEVGDVSLPSLSDFDSDDDVALPSLNTSGDLSLSFD